MKNDNSLGICFMGGKQAGIIGALTVLSRGDRILAAVSYSDDLTAIMKLLKVPVYKSMYGRRFVATLKRSDLLLSVHGREAVGSDLLKLPKYGCINMHPYLYKYKGRDPVGRALRDGEFKASIGVHMMDDKIDSGSVIREEFVDVAGSKDRDSIYNKLYPYYSKVLIKVLGGFREARKKNTR